MRIEKYISLSVKMNVIEVKLVQEKSGRFFGKCEDMSVGEFQLCVADIVGRI